MLTLTRKRLRYGCNLLGTIYLALEKYFAGADLPIAYFYTDQVREEDLKETVNLDRCLIGNLKRVQEGYSFVYDAHTPGCSGGKRYSGFSKTLRPKFEYFLSCGIPGELEGERYKKSPQLVEEYLKSHPAFEAPGKYLVFKRLDKLTEEEKPFAVIFFATPDVLSGLFTLANYDRADPYGVIARWALAARPLSTILMKKRSLKTQDAYWGCLMFLPAPVCRKGN